MLFAACQQHSKRILIFIVFVVLVGLMSIWRLASGDNTKPNQHPQRDHIQWLTPKAGPIDISPFPMHVPPAGSPINNDNNRAEPAYGLISNTHTLIFQQRSLDGNITVQQLRADGVVTTLPLDGLQQLASPDSAAQTIRLGGLSLSPDGAWLVVARYATAKTLSSERALKTNTPIVSASCGIYLLNIASATALTSEHRQGTAPAASKAPDTNAAFTSAIEHASTDISRPRFLFDCPSDSDFQASWYADSQGFFFRQREDKTKPYAVFRYVLATAQRQQLTAPALDNLVGQLLLAAAPASSTSVEGAVRTFLRTPQIEAAVLEHTDLAMNHADKPIQPAQARRQNSNANQTSSQFNAQLLLLRYLDQQHTELSVLHGDDLKIQRLRVFDFTVHQMQWISAELLLLGTEKTIFQYHIPTGQLRPLYQAKTKIESFRWQPQQLTVAELQAQSSIWRYQISRDQHQLVITDHSVNSMPRIAANQLLFLSDRAGHYQIWQQPLAPSPAGLSSFTPTAPFTQAARLLSELPQHQGFTRFSISPDQQHILLSQQGAIYQLSLQDGHYQKVLPASEGANVVNWSTHADAIVYSSNKTGDWQLWRYDVASKQSTALTNDGGYSGIIANNVLYFSRYHRNGLWRKALPDGPAQLILADFDVVNWLNWQLEADGIYYFRPHQGIFRLALSPESGPHDAVTPAQLVMALPTGFIHHFYVAGDYVYYVKRAKPNGKLYQIPLQMAK
jgi:hypothetical protein